MLVENSIKEYIPRKIYLVEYPVHFAGLDVFARMTIVRLDDSTLWVHDPCQLTPQLKSQIDELGEVAYIIAPGTYHHLHVLAFQSHYPNAETFICPGLEKKRDDLHFDWILGNQPDHRWQTELDQHFVQGTIFMAEVVFLHKTSKTLILVDLLENIGDDYTHDASMLLKFWWKNVFHMWNNPKAAPEYQLGWGNKKRVKEGLKTILSWDFDRIIIAHGNLIETDAKSILTKAWKNVLNTE